MINYILQSQIISITIDFSLLSLETIYTTTLRYEHKRQIYKWKYMQAKVWWKRNAKFICRGFVYNLDSKFEFYKANLNDKWALFLAAISIPTGPRLVRGIQG